MTDPVSALVERLRRGEATMRELAPGQYPNITDSLSEAATAISTLQGERDAALARALTGPHLGQHYTIEHDGFSGVVIGLYTTLEGKPGVVMQLDGARVVHVYGIVTLP